MKIYCGSCQEQVFADHRFCRNCGNEITASLDIEQDIRIRLDHKPFGCLLITIFKFIALIVGIIILISFFNSLFFFR